MGSNKPQFNWNAIFSSQRVKETLIDTSTLETRKSSKDLIFLKWNKLMIQDKLTIV